MASIDSLVSRHLGKYLWIFFFLHVGWKIPSQLILAFDFGDVW
jgi:hypothetical protein